MVDKEAESLIATNSIDIGWEQIDAGLSLIVWSRLASWDSENLQLITSEDENLKSYEGFKDIHYKYGRLICWISFGVGSEYIVKGCLILLKSRNKLVINGKNGEQITENNILGLSLGRIVRVIDQFIGKGIEYEIIKISLDDLRDSIRNRDVHSYQRNVRGNNYLSLKSKYIPMLNLLLARLKESELRSNLKDLNNQ